MKESETRQTSPNDHLVYLQKAESFLRTMRLAIEKSEWDAAAVLAVHCAISSCDALTSRFLQKKHIAKDHSRVVGLLMQLPFESREIKTKRLQLSQVLEMKNAAEYQARLIREKEARMMALQAERVFEWARDKL